MIDDHSVVPLESNPEVFTQFARKLGLSEEYSIVDIYSLTDLELLAFMPRPVRALILLFPINSFFEEAKAQADTTGAEEVVWFQQNIKNACGMYALLHSLANNKDLLSPQSELCQFLGQEKNLYQFKEKMADDFVISLSKRYESNFEAGQTEAPSADEDVDLHYITFVKVGHAIYELDGRRTQGPHRIGTSLSNNDEQDLLLQPAIADRVAWYMAHAKETNSMQFSLLGLAPTI